MHNNLTLFSNYVCQKLLRLEKGDALSVNTEESDFETAKAIAAKAVSITGVQVKIVITNNGKPVEVTEYDPDFPSVKATGFVLLRIAHVKDRIDTNKNVLDIYVEKDDLAAMQKLGHLAEPLILHRKISIPYCVIPSYSEDSFDGFDDQLLNLDYRIKFLNHTDIDKLHFIGTDTDFYINIPENNIFIGSHIKLSTGREFINDFDYRTIKTNVDKNSFVGQLSGKATILGKEQEICFSDKSFTKSKEFIQLFQFDSDLKFPGYLEMQDKKFVLYFGGALVSCLACEPEDEEQLDKSINRSLYKIGIELDPKLSIYYCGCDNKEKELVRNGFFLE